ncbi:MAG TPA: hypothetical protein VFZ59_05710 [Verrucomicrobiae bacterium]|nr:hypothetical protein [Verrucomicrobiae bacterium]
MVVLVPVGILGGCLAFDARTISRAKPPASVRTIEAFLAWKKEDVTGQGTFETGGVTYTVVLGRPARSLASGPSAYLFDTNGQFVDWTADMGDFYTVVHRFNLTGGHVKNIKRNAP